MQDRGAAFALDADYATTVSAPADAPRRCRSEVLRRIYAEILQLESSWTSVLIRSLLSDFKSEDDPDYDLSYQPADVVRLKLKACLVVRFIS